MRSFVTESCRRAAFYIRASTRRLHAAQLVGAGVNDGNLATYSLRGTFMCPRCSTDTIQRSTRCPVTDDPPDKGATARGKYKLKIWDKNVLYRRINLIRATRNTAELSFNFEKYSFQGEQLLLLRVQSLHDAFDRSMHCRIHSCVKGK